MYLIDSFGKHFKCDLNATISTVVGSVKSVYI